MKYLKFILTSMFLISLIYVHADLLIDKSSSLSDTIFAASEPDYPPFCIVNQFGAADGFSVELFKEAASAVGLQVVFKVDTWQKIKQELVEGKINALPMVGRSPERERVYDFTFPYHTLHGAVFVRKGTTGINKIEDLISKELIVMKGDNAEEYLQREDISSHIVRTVTFTDAFKLLQSGKHDAVIAQRLMGLQLLDFLHIKDIVPLDIELSGFSQDFSFAVQEGDKELLAKLNEGLAIIIANGTYDDLHKKWFTPDFQRHFTFKEKLKIALYVLIPLTILISLISIIVLRLEVKRKTKNLNQEIERRKKIENSIRESETWLRKIIDNNPHFIFIKDEEGIYQIVNKAMAEAYGLSPLEIEGKKDTDFISSEADVIRYKAQDLKIFNGESKRLDIDGSFTDNKGNTRFMHTIKVPFDLLTSGKKAVLGVSSDVTVLRRVEAELTGKNVVLEKEIEHSREIDESLKERNEYIETLLENMPIGFALNTIDDGVTRYVNSKFSEIYGWPKEKLTKVEDFFLNVFPDPEYRKELSEKVYSDMASGDVNRMQWKDMLITRSDGEKRYATAINIPLLEQNLMISTVQDTTARKKAEDQLKDYQEKLELMIDERTKSLLEKTASYEDSQLALSYLMEDVNDTRFELEKVNSQYEAVNKELEAFSYSISHDLRAPLRAIDGFSKIIEEDYFDKLDDEAKECINIIRNNAQMMGLLINDLLEFSRLSRKDIKLYEIDMNVLLQDLIEDFERNNRNRKIEFKLHKFENIKADKSMIRQVLQNLISNAVKYSKTREKAVIECGCLQREKDMVYFIKDNGVGFDMKYIDKLFRVFQRLHTTEEFEGTGVGLAIVQRIIIKHGGNVWAEGEVDKGATFFFSIPK